MPLMKRAGAPIESLFRSTYDLFIYNHREGVWDPSSFDEENDLTFIAIVKEYWILRVSMKKIIYYHRQ